MRETFDFREGPAHRRDSVREAGHTGAHCEGEWLCDNNNAKLLDEIVPLWPNMAGVRPAEGVEEEKPAGGEQQRPAVLLNLFLGGGEDKPIRLIEGHAREMGAPVRLAGEVVNAIAEPGSATG